MEFRLSRTLNILMISVWLITQTLVVSHAHASNGHATGPSIGMTHEAAGSSLHEHKDHAVQHEAGNQNDTADTNGDMSHIADECCGVPCQTAQVQTLEPFGLPLSPEKLSSVHLNSTVFWTPGFQTPPPNPAI